MTAIAKPITEKQFMGQVVQLAKLFGWLVYHTHDSRRSIAGFPDLILLRGGRMLVIELKVGKNRATAEQVAWLREFSKTGAFVAVWTPEHWGEIQGTLGDARASPALARNLELGTWN